MIRIKIHNKSEDIEFIQYRLDIEPENGTGI